MQEEHVLWFECGNFPLHFICSCQVTSYLISFLDTSFDKNARVAGGFWRRGGETPSTVKREDRIIEIREGSWSYLAGTIGRVPGTLSHFLILLVMKEFHILS